VVAASSTRRVFPEIEPIAYQQAVTESLEALSPDRVERVWEGMGRDVVRMKHEGFFIDYRCVHVDASAQKAYEIITSLGGEAGWLYADWLWRLRGWIDRLINPRRITRNEVTKTENTLRVGDGIDYYRVEEIGADRMMRLHSELWAPGDGWMEWRIEDGVLKQTAFFAPHGLPGFLYWYSLGPLHRLVFGGLIAGIQRQGERR
jgi:Protein of unknown function (DUF2867)